MSRTAYTLIPLAHQDCAPRGRPRQASRRESAARPIVSAAQRCPEAAAFWQRGRSSRPVAAEPTFFVRWDGGQGRKTRCTTDGAAMWVAREGVCERSRSGCCEIADDMGRLGLETFAASAEFPRRVDASSTAPSHASAGPTVGRDAWRCRRRSACRIGRGQTPTLFAPTYNASRTTSSPRPRA